MPFKQKFMKGDFHFVLRGETERWAPPAPLSTPAKDAPSEPAAVPSPPAIANLTTAHAIPEEDDHREANDAARELFIENEKLAAENEQLRTRLSDLEKQVGAIVSASKDQPTEVVVANPPETTETVSEAPAKKKPGRPKKVRPETADAKA